MLAARIMTEQGIQITALHVRTSLTYARRDRLAGREPAGPSRAERAANVLGLDLVTIDVFDEYIPVILHRHYSYGSGMNPCVDCRIFLLRQAKVWMGEHDHRFVFTGEVLGQRPNSQMPSQLRIVERESGLEGYLLRPLSAKLLEPTIPEQRGWVDREELYAFSGRSRRPQMALAEQFSITDYPQPAGGSCFLVDRHYSRRLRDFLDHEGSDPLTNDRAFLLAVGRHFRLPSGRKLIVGRHEGENEYIRTQSAEGLLLTTTDLPGPTTLLLDDPSPEEIEQAARLTARYASGEGAPAILVEVRRESELSEVLTVGAMAAEDVRSLMV